MIPKIILQSLKQWYIIINLILYIYKYKIPHGVEGKKIIHLFLLSLFTFSIFIFFNSLYFFFFSFLIFISRCLVGATASTQRRLSVGLHVLSHDVYGRKERSMVQSYRNKAGSKVVSRPRSNGPIVHAIVKNFVPLSFIFFLLSHTYTHRYTETHLHSPLLLYLYQ